MFSPVVVLSEGKATIEAGLPRPSHILHTVAHCHAWIHPPMSSLLCYLGSSTCLRVMEVTGAMVEISGF